MIWETIVGTICDGIVATFMPEILKSIKKSIRPYCEMHNKYTTWSKYGNLDGNLINTWRCPLFKDHPWLNKEIWQTIEIKNWNSLLFPRNNPEVRLKRLERIKLRIKIRFYNVFKLQQ